MASDSTDGKSVVVIATASERRVLRTKLLCFYAKYEPDKPMKDVLELVEWILANGEAALNEKLKKKYNSDLSSIRSTSLVELPLTTQLKLFYGEFDPNRTAEEIKRVENWVGFHGVDALNMRMVERYNENLNTMCFGGSAHLLVLLQAFYARHDASRLQTDQVRAVQEWTVFHGPLKLNEKLLNKYGDILHLTVEDIQNSYVDENFHKQRGREASELPDMETWNKQKPKNAARLSLRSMTSGMSSVTGTGTAGGESVLDPEHLQRLVELFYAKYSPQKLVEGGVEKVVNWAKRHGLTEINAKMKANYGKDLIDIEDEYDLLYEALEKFYAKHDPKKLDVAGGIDDVAAWGVVHSPEELNVRLVKKFGVGIHLPKSEASLAAAPLPTPQPLGLGQKAAPGMVHRISVTGPPGAPVNLPKPSAPGAAAPPPPPAPSATPERAPVAASPPAPPAPSVTTVPVSNPVADLHAQESFKEKEVTSEHDMEQEMDQMRKAVSGKLSGKYSHLALRLAAFYSKHDPQKLKDTAAVDTIIKWTLKHGVDKLNQKLTEKWGENLDDVKISVKDETPPTTVPDF